MSEIHARFDCCDSRRGEWKEFHFQLKNIDSENMGDEVELRECEVQYDEFLKVLNFKENESALKALFWKVDGDGSGELSAQEVREEIARQEKNPQNLGMLRVLRDIEKQLGEDKINFSQFSELCLKRK
ncbi:hypothetical protein ElyMa_005625700 [Elysia marginata]|uniref:EF-hand domain-containing protein n=1 Tax=Elysia marginata TaxID=1093978 RepID=A0AAV4F790_9GAST|nr:hypothetical protein ElyMa_005625700 [Elysia marginata]